MSYVDHQYINLLRRLYDKGSQVYPDRTGVGRIKLFSEDMKFDLSKGYPFDTTRQIFFKTMLKETLSFIHGYTDTDQIGKIWDQWTPRREDAVAYMNKHVAQEDIDKLGEARIMESLGIGSSVGTIGPLYGASWRYGPSSGFHPLAPTRKFEDLPKDKVAKMRIWFEQNKVENPDLTEEAFQAACVQEYHRSYDQLHEAFLDLRDDPFTSRACVVAWQTPFLPYKGIDPKTNVLMGRGALAPCHIYFQFLCEKNEQDEIVLNCQLVLRSNDLPVGNPYNVSQYALITHMFAQCLGYKPGVLAVKMIDCHIYANQLEKMSEHVTREPFPFPTLKINPDVKNLYDFSIDDFQLENYQHHPKIDYPVAV